MDDITFEFLIEQYFYYKLLRPTTMRSYRKVLRTFEEFTSLNPAQVDQLTVLQWRHIVLGEHKRSSRTWNNKVSHMRALFNFGMEQELLPHKKNPFNGSVVRAGAKKKKVLTKSQMDDMYRRMAHYLELEEKQGYGYVCDGRKNALYPAWFWMTVMNVFRYTAIRQGQLLHIRLNDINLEEKWIHLCEEGAKNHREHQVPIDQAFNVGWFDLMKRKKHPKKMGEYPLRSFFKRLSTECNFIISPHRFRHTVATHMMQSPERNLYVVKRLLGHASITSTLEYIDESVDNLRDILEAELM
ncbi:TPA: tyrosine-type recombinase/integrase [Proteus mirabilis]|uniref:tyrosine-type recombinase/integrase n=1 Tax=Proteus mirabilis TaxID=584 RepID=UPI001B9430ED|nr:site-specific integrase [Proteus mirabilis]HBC8684061.1 site-specific integrase [Proteus mirabilis]HCR3465139.1 site-specific integrase [Proteus mirabilis]HCR3666495.1 site-specific integrase [Proteus mirabilis]HCT9440666.1 site-specific integrase [Proteus mirabilis]